MKNKIFIGLSMVLAISFFMSTNAWSAEVLAEGYYVIKAKHSEKYLDVPMYNVYAGTRVKQWQFNGGQNQVWELDYLPSDDAYLLIPKHTQKPYVYTKCLDISWGSTATGADAIQDYRRENLDHDSQKWLMEIIPEDDHDYYKIVNRNSGLCLEVAGDYSYNGAQVQQNEYTGADSQKWFFSRAVVEDEPVWIRVVDEFMMNGPETWGLVASALWGLTMEGRYDPLSSIYSTIAGIPWCGHSFGEEAYEDERDRKYAELKFNDHNFFDEDSRALLISNIAQTLWMTKPEFFDMFSEDVQEALSLLVHQPANVMGPFEPDDTDATVSSRNYNPDEFDDEAWFYANGIAIDAISAEKNGIMLANAFGRRVSVIHNPTDGIVNDLLECGLTRLGGPIDHSPLIEETVYENLKDPEKTKVVLLAHSGGTIQTAYALHQLMGRDLAEDEWAKLEVYNFATCASDYKIENLPQSVHIEHYANERDPVCWLGGLSTIPEIHNNQQGRMYIHKGKWGHLFNMYYLEELNDYDPEAPAGERNIRFTQHKLVDEPVWLVPRISRKVWTEVSAEDEEAVPPKLYGYMYGRAQE